MESPQFMMAMKYNELTPELKQLLPNLYKSISNDDIRRFSARFYMVDNVKSDIFSCFAAISMLSDIQDNQGYLVNVYNCLCEIEYIDTKIFTYPVFLYIIQLLTKYAESDYYKLYLVYIVKLTFYELNKGIQFINSPIDLFTHTWLSNTIISDEHIEAIHKVSGYTLR